MGIVIGGSAILQVAFFFIVSSASVYAELLGGTQTFSGLPIGTSPAIPGIFLIFIARYDKGQYSRPLLISITYILGNAICALVYPLHLFLGRIVSGFGFISFTYSKCFCADPRIVSVRRRTMVTGCLVLTQAVAFSAEPLLGGVLYKDGFGGSVFNGVTAPGCLLAGVFVAFWGPSLSTTAQAQGIPLQTEIEPESQPTQIDPFYHATTSLLSLTHSQTLCFFILGAWKANIALPDVLSSTPFSAGNFIAHGGLVSFSLLVLTTLLSGRLWDRFILGLGTSLGLTRLLLNLALLLAERVRSVSPFVSWALAAVGFNLASTCLSLLSNELPETYTRHASMAIQDSNYAGHLSGAVLGGSGVKMGMVGYVGVQLGVWDKRRPSVPCLPVDTFKFVRENDNGVGTTFNHRKFHIRTIQVKTLTAAEATTLAGTDPDYGARLLHEAIENQAMTPARKARLGGTKPLKHFDEIEQGFSPSHLIPCVEATPDSLLQACLFIYPDTQRNRLGVSSKQLPCNRPLDSTRTVDYQRGGRISYVSQKNCPNYDSSSQKLNLVGLGGAIDSQINVSKRQEIFDVSAYRDLS
ncbi:hypothetical protein CVT26_010886 [Gymnopilus dilepis]|uniref:Catalase core domain-containing protein n=1 Tax=Gymnopilus dilepis TaxID=231916 RepID=A0A409VIV0_9AGAR|nr:hypothetical protein CVT26_010886 [Gymnopilus dilepis]